MPFLLVRSLMSSVPRATVRTLKPKNFKNLKIQKFKSLGFYQPWASPTEEIYFEGKERRRGRGKERESERAREREREREKERERRGRCRHRVRKGGTHKEEGRTVNSDPVRTKERRGRGETAAFGE